MKNKTKKYVPSKFICEVFGFDGTREGAKAELEKMIKHERDGQGSLILQNILDRFKLSR